jgi:hypothetical protein
LGKKGVEGGSIHSGALRVMERQVVGGAGKRVEQAIVKVPPGPWVGVKRGEGRIVALVFGGMAE